MAGIQPLIEFLFSDAVQFPAREALYDITVFLAIIVAVNIELIDSDGYKPLLRCLVWTIVLMYGGAAIVTHYQRADNVDVRDILIVPAILGAVLMAGFFVFSRRRTHHR